MYTDNNNTADQISGSAEAGATITATRTAPAPTSSYSTTSTGSYSMLVAVTNGKPNPAIPVTYTITAHDAAGNTSGVTTLNYNDTR